MRSGIYAVGRYLVLDHSFGLEMQILLGRSPYYRRLGQHHYSLMGSAYAQFILGANHAHGFHSAYLRLLDLEISGKNRTYPGKENFLSCSHIGRTAHYCKRLGATVINLSDMQMIAIRMGLTLNHSSHNNSGQPSGDLFTFLNSIHFYAYGGHSFCYLRRTEFALQIVL